MELRNLYYFLQLCEDGNYSLAANKLYITQQALSKSIKGLENELGAALFVKSPTGVSLTPYGKAVYPVCKEMIHHVDIGMQKIRTISPDGLVPIRLAISYQSADSLSFTLLEDFHTMHPDIPVLSDAMEDLPAEEAVLSGNADFVLSVGVPRDSGFFHYDRIRQMPLCVMVGPEHPFYEKEKLNIEDLDHMDLHCAGPQFKTYHLLSQKAKEAGIHINLIPTSGHLYSTYKNIFSMNRAIIGIYGDQEIPDFPQIRQIPFVDPGFNWDIYLCYEKDHVLSESEEIFYQYILGFSDSVNPLPPESDLRKSGLPDNNIR
jgi:DNA-binding transcriptional LysR family regulator